MISTDCVYSADHLNVVQVNLSNARIIGNNDLYLVCNLSEVRYNHRTLLTLILDTA
jgi:hypothetical protein